MEDFRNSSLEQLKGLDHDFTQWIYKVQWMCEKAVFRNEKSLMEFLWRNLLQKVDSITKVRMLLEEHLEKLRKEQASTSSPSPTGSCDAAKFFVSPAITSSESGFPTVPKLYSNPPSRAEKVFSETPSLFSRPTNLVDNVFPVGSRLLGGTMPVENGFDSSLFFNKSTLPKETPAMYSAANIKPIGFPKPASVPTIFPAATVSKEINGGAVGKKGSPAKKPSPASVKPLTFAQISKAPAGKEEDGEWSTVTRKHKSKEVKTGNHVEKVVEAKPKEVIPEVVHVKEAANVSSGEPVDKKKVFLMRLPRELADSQLLGKYFKAFGTVVDVYIFRNRDGTPTGSGYVDFSEESAVRSVFKHGLHFIGEHQLIVKEFEVQNEDGRRKHFQIFLGGIPTFMTQEEVKAAVEQKFKVRDLALKGGYAWMELANEADVDKLLNLKKIKIGEKMVECKPYQPKPN
ncbi:squamous cell carcinoma antigen recognized by T-cells 3-like [Paramacrobiotus metropolitanus]|uniref:squamous cell carcinoma antigen recognized by T-cells 3-like n=1 Tax=Paramacrobiotus metropolitanus TaxID=2943436 RepID=UPI0024459CF7|nr:squamous cell carcinoma antigen recognized by T-cells 3-like [Paramacrobiotus metropolitanus]